MIAEQKTLRAHALKFDKLGFNSENKSSSCWEKITKKIMKLKVLNVNPYFNKQSYSSMILITGNLLTCDCHLSYLHHYLTRAPQQLTDSSLLSAVCATPPSLSNAPLAQLPVTELTCDPEQEYYYRYLHHKGDFNYKRNC